MFLLVTYFIHISVYMSIPISQFIPPPPPPLLVLSIAESYPKLTGVKHPPFDSAHRFRGSGMLEGNSGDSPSLLHDIWDFNWDDLSRAGGSISKIASLLPCLVPVLGCG